MVPAPQPCFFVAETWLTSGASFLFSLRKMHSSFRLLGGRVSQSGTGVQPRECSKVLSLGFRFMTYPREVY